MKFDPNKPFNDLPPLPPNEDVETKPVLKKAITANRALAELKGLGDRIPSADHNGDGIVDFDEFQTIDRL